MTDSSRFEIAKLELREGDRLVIKCDQVLSGEQTQWIEDRFRKLIPEGVEIIVLGAGISLAVLKATGNYIPPTLAERPASPPPKPRK